MKSKSIIAIILALIFALSLAAPVLAAYYSTISVTESDGQEYDMLPVSVSIDIDYMAENNFIEADGRDVRVKTIAGAEIPFMLVDDKVLFAGSIDNNRSNQFRFSTGNSLLTDFEIVTGHNGYITTADHANLEPSNNFEIEYDGYLDTSAYYPYVHDSVTSSEDTAVNSHTVDLPDYVAGDLLIVFFGIDYGLPCEPNFPAGWTDSDSSYGCYGWKVAAGDEGTTITVTTGGYDGESAHVSLAIRNYVGSPSFSLSSSATSAAPNSQILTASVSQHYLWLSAFGGRDNTLVTLDDVPTNYGDEIYKVSGAGYAYAGVAFREIAAISENPGAFTLSDDITWRAWTIRIAGRDFFIDKDNAVEVYVSDTGEITATIDSAGTPKSVTATGITAGDYNLKVGADATDLYIKIDDSTEDSETLSGASVPDNANDWIVRPIYLNYYKLTTASTLRLTYQPVDIIDSATLPNAEAAGTYDGAITYGSNTLVSVATSGLETTEAVYPTDPTDSQDIIRPTTAALFDVNLDRLAANPLQPFVALIASTANLTERLVWLAGAFILFFLVVLFILDKSDGDLSFTFFGGAGYCTVVYLLGIFPLWIAIVFCFAGIASLVYEKVIAL